MPPWRNKWLIGAICLSMAQHVIILYTPLLAVSKSINSLQAWFPPPLVIASYCTAMDI